MTTEFRMRFVSLLVAALLSRQIAYAHEEPCGDVCPRVVVENGRFHVYYINNGNVTGEDGKDDRRVLVDVWGTDGKLIASRKVADGFAPDSEGYATQIDAFFFGRWYGQFGRDAQGSVMVVAAVDSQNVYIRRKKVSPCLSIGPEISNDVAPFARQPGAIVLPRPMPRENTRVADVIVTGNRVALLQATLGKTTTLSLATHSLDDRRPISAELGEVDDISGFPTSSRIVATGDLLLVAWLERRPDGATYDLTSGSRLFLSAYDTMIGCTRTIVLHDKVHWNTQISLGVTGMCILVAYQRGTPRAWSDPSIPKGKILCIFRDLQDVVPEREEAVEQADTGPNELVLLDTNPPVDADNAKEMVIVGHMQQSRIDYWDLNNDDQVDLESHHTGVHDGGLARWYRIDDDYDGFYDREVRIFEKMAGGRSREIRIHEKVSALRKLNKVRLTHGRVRELREAW